MLPLQAHAVTFRAEGSILGIEFRYNSGEIFAEAHLPDTPHIRQRLIETTAEAEHNGRLDALIDDETATAH